MTNFQVHTGKPTVKNWNDAKVEKKLESLVNADKKSSWVHRNLSIDKSGFFGRVFWGVAKHFDWMRRTFYDIDLDKSKAILEELQPQISSSGNANLKNLFNKAVNKFNSIAPHHWVTLPQQNGATWAGAPPAPPAAELAKLTPQQKANVADNGMAAESKAKDLLQGQPPGTFLHIFDPVATPAVYGNNSNLIVYVDNKGAIKSDKLSAKESANIPSFLEKNAKKYMIPFPKAPQPPKKLEEGLQMQRALKEGANPNDLLVKAIQEEKPEAAAWLLKNGATLEALERVTDRTASQKELCEWLHKLVNTPEINPKNIDAFALGLGYGYKSANLMVLQAKAEKMNESLKTATVKVPPFIAMGDFEMRNYLMKAIPGLQKRWEGFLDSFDKTLKDKFMDPTVDASKVPLKISPEGQKIMLDIHKQITDHFINSPYYTLQIEEWLKKEKPDFVIVRSTGKEDSDNNSNAGGNESIPFVKPNAQAITDAMGKVIASYFGEKSVGQRLLAGDRSLFSEKTPFIPVLIQTMIGENVGGIGSKNDEIPRSGVLFTRQSDKAEGVTFIQTGLGNNEGVVSSRVGVDSYYVGEDKHIHAVVRKKATRFVSIEEGGKFKCEPIKNQNQTLENSQALPDKVILDIKKVADDISASYGAEKGGVKPMDMEYTVKLKDKTSDKPVIYLLQARPLLSTAGQTPVEKTFLDLKQLTGVPKNNKILAETLLDGNAYVREIEKPGDVLFADDITKALHDYTHADSAKIKAIVIKKTAPSTSHEAVVLRPKGVAVMVVQDPEQYEHVKKLVDGASDKNPLLIDPQRGMIVDTHSVADPKAAVKKGLISYPIPLEFSIPRKGVVTNLPKAIDPKVHKDILQAQLELSELRYNDLIKTLLNGKDFLPMQSKAHPDGFSMHGLFDELATADAANAKVALATILKLLHQRLKKNMVEVEDFRADINQMMYAVFEAAVKMAKNEIVPALDKYPPQSLNRLYPIKFLDALVFQWPSENVVGQFSYARVLNTERSEKVQIEKAKQAGVTYGGPHAFKQLKLQQFAANAFSPECEKNWSEFIKEINELAKKNPGPMNECYELITKIQSWKLEPVWLNKVFNNAWNAHGKGNAVKVLADLQKVQDKNKETLKWVSEKTQDLEILNQQIKQWANPEFVKKNAAKMRDQYINKLGFDLSGGSESLRAKYNASDEFGRLALLQYMRRAVTIYDETIKEAKGSTLYPDDNAKVKDFAELLKGYFTMMESCIRMIPSSDEYGMMKPNMGTTVTFADYIKGLHQGRSYSFGWGGYHSSVGFDKLIQDAQAGHLNAAQHLEARAEFSVDSFIIGSKSDLNFSSHWPTRLEEYFTTFHQNMEKVAKYLNTKNGMNATLLSSDAKDTCNLIKSYFGEDISALNAEGSMIEISYQVPLRQHSSAVNVSYDAKTPEKGIDIAIQMFGNDEHDRWDQAAAFSALLANIGDVTFTKGNPPKINYAASDGKREGVSFSLHIPHNYKDKDKLIPTLSYICKTMTMGSIGQTSGLKNKMKDKLPGGDWKKVKDGFFADAFYLNNTLMSEFSQSKDQAMVVKIAKNSLLGMARQGVKDYTLHSSADAAQLAGYLGDAKYKYVPGNSGWTTSNGLKLGSTLYLLKALNENPGATYPVILELINNPDMKQKLPDTVKALQQAIASFKKPEEKLDDLVTAQDIPNAYVLASQLKNEEVLKLIKLSINTKIDQVKKKDSKSSEAAKTLLEWAKGFYALGLEKEVDDLILSKISDNAALIDEIKEMKQVKNRAEHYNNLAANITTLKNKTIANAKTFNDYKEILDLSAKCLIGLSQSADFHSSYGDFPGLDGYLGKPKYDYVFENVHSNTSKLRKAAPLYIIQGLENANNQVKQEAVKAFEALTADFLIAGKNSLHSAPLQNALFAISRGYYDAQADKTKAAEDLAKIWKKDAVTLDALAKYLSSQGKSLKKVW